MRHLGIVVGQVRQDGLDEPQHAPDHPHIGDPERDAAFSDQAFGPAVAAGADLGRHGRGRFVGERDIDDFFEMAIEISAAFLVELLLVEDQHDLAVALLAQKRRQSEHVGGVEALAAAFEVVDANDLLPHRQERQGLHALRAEPPADQRARRK